MPNENAYQWRPGSKFNDSISHFQRFTEQSIQKYFSAAGRFGREDLPNWVKRIDSNQFQLITLDSENNEVRDWPIWIDITPRGFYSDLREDENARSKYVAQWNYTMALGEIKLSSNTPTKPIIASNKKVCGEMLVHSMGVVRMSSSHGNGKPWCEMEIGIYGEIVPLTPYVTLAFFMWYREADDALACRKYMVSQLGWDDAKT